MKKFAVISASALCLATGAIAEEHPYSLPFNAANEFSQIGVTWAETLAEATGGKVQFEAAFNGGLVSIPEALDAVGSGVLACRDAFVETIDDWAGKKIRAAGRWQAKQVEILGGSPVALPASDVYTALQTGTVDCSLTVPTIYLASSMYEVAPYFSGYQLTGNALITVVGMDVWDALSEEQRATVERVSSETTLSGTKGLRTINETALTQVETTANLYRVTEENRQRLAPAWDPVFAELASEITDETSKSLVTTLTSLRQ
ncbi:TRAP transporter substrate-binding protein [Maritimibacter alexandrii]|uniref:TRAP transporter substrate-binding protein n=1 Tax=Maritimibacter alexandrii TaxID=2570355 RepID=UPI001109ED54|nr:TRAP transporter substrate-binding protein DctP [Maritimibacter alexandrii]